MTDDEQRPREFRRVSVRDLRPPRAVDYVPTLRGKVGILVAKVEAAANRADRERAAKLQQIEDRLDDIEAEHGPDVGPYAMLSERGGDEHRGHADQRRTVRPRAISDCTRCRRFRRG